MTGNRGEDAPASISGGDGGWEEGCPVRVVSYRFSYGRLLFSHIDRMLRDDRVPTGKQSVVSEEELAELLNDDD